MTAQAWLGIAVGVAAVIEDVGWRRVSNWTSGGAFLAGLAAHAGTDGWRGAGTAVLGGAAGFGVFLACYLLSGMGGGDVKLMAGFGALTGIGSVLYAALLAAVAGGILALCVLAVSRLRRRMAGHRETPEAIPYAPAIVIGAWLTLISGV
jgi:prepilin peptidase CpaA